MPRGAVGWISNVIISLPTVRGRKQQQQHAFQLLMGQYLRNVGRSLNNTMYLHHARQNRKKLLRCCTHTRSVLNKIDARTTWKREYVQHATENEKQQFLLHFRKTAEWEAATVSLTSAKGKWCPTSRQMVEEGKMLLQGAVPVGKESCVHTPSQFVDAFPTPRFIFRISLTSTLGRRWCRRPASWCVVVGFGFSNAK